MREKTIWQRILYASKDLPLIIGALIAAALILLAVIGPEIAPRNPFYHDRIQYIDGELQRAPFSPGAVYPLGTDANGIDLLSLILYGARTTISIVLAATALRLMVGFFCGVLAGWWSGSWFDRLVLGLIQLFAAVPPLILAVILILALGIRMGPIAFIAAIAVTGWGEIAQILRSHVISIRQMDYVEGAYAVGVEPLEILSRHVLPNLLGVLLSIAALEAGQSLLLLGELGFVQVFVGGGGLIAGDAGTANRAFAEMPEWGAMLGSTWRWFRTFPWLPGIPALLFAVSILGFNLLGTGLQRFVDRGRFYPSGVSVLRFLAASAAVLLAVQFLITQLGPRSRYDDSLAGFDGLRAWRDLTFLADPSLEGRYPGSEGRSAAASRIASVFEQAGLTPLATGSYYQFYPTLVGNVTTDSVLEVYDSDDLLVRLDEAFSYHPFYPVNADDTRLEGDLHVRGVGYARPGEVLQRGLYLVVEGEGFEAAAAIVPDEGFEDLVHPEAFHAPATFLDTVPVFQISESSASYLLSASSLELEDLMQRVLVEEERVDIPLDLTASVEYGMEYSPVSAVNVVGYIPGSDIRIQTQRILVAVPYTGLMPIDGRIYPGADENASGVAVLLEVVRLWQEVDFQPLRTVVFAAFDQSGGQQFAEAPPLGDDEQTWTVVMVEGVGAGEPYLSRLGTASYLERMFDQSAREVDVTTRPLEDYEFFFDRSAWWGYTIPSRINYSGLAITREGDALSGTVDDTRYHLDPDQIEEAGEVLAHFLMVLSSR